MSRRFEETIGHAKFKLWFRSTQVRVAGESVEVAAPNRFVAGWIERHFHAPLLPVVREELGERATMRVLVEPGAPPAPQPPAAPRDASTAPEPGAASAAAPAAPRPAPPPNAPPRTAVSLTRPATLRHDLADFVVGPSNELAYTAAQRLADEPDCRMNPLFIHGACGLGKTHLLQGLCRRFAHRRPAARWCYTTAEQFTNQFIQAVRRNRLAEFRRRLRRLDLLAVDDVHFLADKTKTLSEFQYTFDEIDLHGAKLVLASDAHPRQIERFGQALISRFISGMVVRVNPPQTQTRVKLIDALARRRGLRLAEGVNERLAGHGERSVREIEGLLTKLAALASLENGDLHAAPEPRKIGHALARQALGGPDDAASPPRRPIRFELILQIVCREIGVERAQALGKGRHRRVVLARSLAIYLARRLTPLSYPDLARAMGRSNHSTIVTAAQRVQRQVREKRETPPLAAEGPTTTDRLADRLQREIIQTAARNAA